MGGKCRPSLRAKTLENVKRCNLSETDKDCIKAVFELAEQQQAEIEWLETEKDNLIKTYAECATVLVKEFAERVKDIYSNRSFDERIDNLVKEMVGEG